MSAGLAVLVHLALAQLSAPAAEAAAARPPASVEIDSQFSIRADRALSRRLNPVLARVGRPVTATISGTSSPTSYLSALCGFARPTWSLVGATAYGEEVIEHAPCLLADANVEIEVRRGDSIPAFGLHIGLLESSLADLRLERAPGSPGKGSRDLFPKDRVIVPVRPEWTSVTVAAARKLDRASMIAELAGALSCFPNETPEACLQRYRVSVIDDTPRPIVPKITASPPRPRPEEMPGPLSRAAPRFPSAANGVFLTRVALKEDGQDPPIEATPAPAASPPVPSDQWPFDAARIARLLGPLTGLTRSPIAVIDIGLMTAEGGPLERDSFASEDAESTDKLRIFGGGAPFRAGGAAPVSICEAQAANLPELLQHPEFGELYSHGAVTASLATGHVFRSRLRGVVPAGLLPQLYFLRLYESPCPPNGVARVSPSHVIRAVQAISDKVEIINLSFQDSGDESSGLPDALMNAIRASEKLLVVPAGNDAGDDFANLTGQLCPACLADPRYERGGPAIARRVLAVGAAGPGLQAETYSGFGLPTVLLYAPGDAKDAINLAGADASGYAPGTSYAAPRVAFAAALAQSLAPTVGMDRIVKRLLISTWPLHEVGANGALRIVEKGGVLDLNKVAALRTYVIEAFEDEGEGAARRTVRRTYVGKLSRPMRELSLCAGAGYPADQWMGVVLRPPTDATGYRELIFYPQYATAEVSQPEHKSCKPAGDVTIEDVLAGAKTIPLERVTLILPPLKP